MKKQLAILLAFLLVITGINPVFAIDTGKTPVEVTEDFVVEKSQGLIDLEDQVAGKIKDEEIVPVIITFNTEYFSYLGSPATVSELRTDAGKDKQINFADRVNKEALSMLKSTYPNFELLYELNLLAAGVTGYVDYKTAKKIAGEEYIQAIEVSPEYNRPAKPEELVSPYMVTSGKIVEADKIHSKYKGEKQVIAVLDSGIELDHPAYYLSEGTEVLLTEEDIKNAVEDKKVSPGGYFKDKIPFYYNYADKNQEVADNEQAGGFHGYHVSGTIGGNKVTLPDGSEFIGIAPEAQLLAMKVFRTSGGGTGPVYYLKAIEDAVKLGASSVNMSLGSPAGSVTTVGKNVDDMLKKASEAGCIVAIAAGNESQFGYGVDNPDAHNPDYGIVGSPSVATLGLSVASMENTHLMTTTLTVHLDGKEYVYPYNIKGENTLTPEREYSFVYANLGKEEDFESLDLKGKVALMERGDNTFSEKALNAEKNGAIAAIIFNHEAGGDDTIGMVIEGVTIPVLSIGHSAGLLMAQNQNVAKFSISSNATSVVNPNGGVISDFSNWGLSAEGSFKPEILAPGGHIYSTMNNKGYGDMSGTSMATPHVAGGIALVRQRVEAEFPNLSGEEKFSLVKELLMSTALPHENRNGSISSPRHQGAGIMKLNAAVNTPAILSDPGKNYSAVALGDVENTFTFDVEIKNLTDRSLTYKYYTNVTTDEVVDGKFSLNPRFLYKTEPQTVKVGPKESKVLTINVDVSQFADELQTLMPNGYFIEGFVIFESDSEVEISYPFVGFKGSWEKLAVLEPSIYPLVEEGRLPFYYDPEGKTRDYTHFYGKVDGKEIIAGSSVDFSFENPKFEDKLVISPNRDGNMDQIKFAGTFLRNFSSVEGYIYETENGQITGNGNKIFSSSNGKKNHFSNNKSWSKSTTGYSWYFDGRRDYMSTYPDGEYKIAIGAKAMGSKTDGSAYEAQWTYFDLIIDTVAPDVKNAKLDGDTLSFDVIEEGSGIRSNKLYYIDGEEEVIISPNVDGSYTLPQGINQEQIKIQIIDQGYNKFEDNVATLLYEGSLGSLTLEIKADEGNPIVNYKVVKAEDENIEMDNLKRLPIGDYILIVEDTGEYKNLSGNRIPFSITEDDLNPTIEIKLEKVQIGELSTKIYKPDDLDYKLIEIIAKDKENPTITYKLEQGDGYYNEYFYADVPYGTYELEVNLPEGYKASYNKEVVVESTFMELPEFINIVKGELAVIKTEDSSEDGKDFDVEYEALDLETGGTYPIGEIGNSSFLVYPKAVPQGYYADPQYYVIDVDNIDERPLKIDYDENGKKYYICEFVYRLQDGTGDIEVDSQINGEDNFTAEYYVEDFYAYEGLGQGKTYNRLNDIPYGTYYVSPIEDTVNKNYTWLPKSQEVVITKENSQKDIKFLFEDLRKSDKKGMVYFTINTDNSSEFLLNTDLEIRDSEGNLVKTHSYNVSNISTELPFGYYEIKPVNLPDKVVSNPEVYKLRLDKTFTFLEIVIEDKKAEAEDNGKILVNFLDPEGKEVQGGEYTITDTANKVYENGKLPNGSYIVRVTKAPEGYKIDGKDSQLVFISDYNKEREVTFKLVEGTTSNNVVLKFKVNYQDHEFVEGIDYKFEGVYKKVPLTLDEYEKVSDSLDNLPKDVLYVKISWLNPNYKVDNTRGDYHFVNVTGPNTELKIYLEEVVPPETKIEIVEVEDIDLTVPFGTEIKDLDLPQSIKVKAQEIPQKGLEKVIKDYEIKVTWDLENTLYDGRLPGIYTIRGILDEKDLENKKLENPKNLEAKALVRVKEEVVPPETKIEIVEVENVDLTVPFGTEIKDLDLPQSIKVKAQEVGNENTEKDYEAKVTWDLENTLYDETLPGTYTIKGILDQKDLENKKLENPKNLEAKALVRVKEEVVPPETKIEIVEVENIDLTVDYGTEIKDLDLPQSIKVKAQEIGKENTEKDYEIKVTWDLENTLYDGRLPGTYTIRGILDEKDLENKKLENPKNLEAKALVRVKEEVVPVDTSRLLELIAIANSLDSRDYTLESYNYLMKYVRIGQRLLVKVDISQEEIDRAVRNISLALDELVRDYGENYSPIDWHIISPIEVSPSLPKKDKPVEIKDYKDHWAEEVIDFVLEKGYMELDSYGNFNPETKSDRLTIVKALALIEKVNPKAYMGPSLKDVDKNSIESGYINWAIEKGIINGYEDGTFRADREISREEMAKILNKYVENLEKDRPILEEINYEDVKDIGDWAKEDVKKATERGLMRGTDEGKFEPKENIIRAQVAQIIYNIQK